MNPGFKDILINKLRNGLNVYGTCITSPAPMWPAVVQKAGLDFVFIDTEHIPLGRMELTRLCQAFAARNIAPIVRILDPDPFKSCQVIDAGAKGVIMPYLESVDQIRELVGATKFRPLKGERLRKILSGQEKIEDPLKSYIENYNLGNICIANIESVPALEKLDDLLNVSGLDAVFIGPHDLSISLNLPEQYDHPVFEDAVKTIIGSCRAKNLSVGIHFSLEPERQIRWMKEGVNIVIHSSDMALFSQRLSEDLKKIKKAAGDDHGHQEQDTPIV